VHIVVSPRKKFSDKAWKGVFVGYAFDSPAWLVYNPTTRKLIRRRNLVFDEKWMDSAPLSRQSQTDSNDEDEDEDIVSHVPPSIPTRPLQRPPVL
jgi:hypothetical protein